MQVYDYIHIEKNKIEISSLKYEVFIILPDSFFRDFEVKVTYENNRNKSKEKRTYKFDTLEDAFEFTYYDIKPSKNLKELDQRYTVFYQGEEARKNNRKLLKSRR